MAAAGSRCPSKRAVGRAGALCCWSGSRAVQNPRRRGWASPRRAYRAEHGSPLQPLLPLRENPATAGARMLSPREGSLFSGHISDVSPGLEAVPVSQCPSETPTTSPSSHRRAPAGHPKPMKTPALHHALPSIPCKEQRLVLKPSTQTAP